MGDSTNEWETHRLALVEALAPAWSCPGSVDDELLSRMLTAAPLRG